MISSQAPKHQKISLEDLAKVNEHQPFSIFGTSRDAEADSAQAAKFPPAGTNGQAHAATAGQNSSSKELDQPMAGDQLRSGRRRVDQRMERSSEQ